MMEAVESKMDAPVNRINTNSSSQASVDIESHQEDKKPGNKNATLERETKSCSSLMVYSFTYIMLDVWKQVTTYGMKYFNSNRYPLPQTEIIAVTELLKLLIFLGIVIYNGQFWQVRISLWYAIPSIIYAVNNNIYYFGLHYATPPVWNILIQLRLVFTALAYRCLFHKKMTNIQWMALGLLMIAISLTHLTGGQTLEGKNNLLIALGLATLGSVTSVAGTLTMEFLFKNDSRSFAEMQTQLYLFGSTMAWMMFIGEVYTSPPIPKDPLPPLQHGYAEFVHFLLVTCILLTCSSGIATAAIVKKLDNIVKLYTQALANMITSVACTLFFPAHFQLNMFFAACLALMFIAIFMYENKNVNLSATLEFFQENRNRVLGFVVLAGTIAVLCFMMANTHLPKASVSTAL